MESYAQVLNYGIPFFMILITIEWIISYYKGIAVNNSMDAISSLSSGMTNTIKDVLGLTVIIVSYGWMVDHLALFEIESTIAVYAIAFIGLDFAGYWQHRFSHRINLFWNRHIIHHSSEEFNLSCALRQSISGIFGVFFFLYLPIAMLGVPQKVIAVVAPLHLFAQFWYHTRLIGRMGFLEHIIVTPSHHRVHHAINDEYMDRNFGQIFIFWDKWFGTFQEELNAVPAVYGVKRPVKTWNPVLINFQHFWLLFKDAWRAESWMDKLRIWFMPTGWRPSDVQQKFPVFAIEDVYKHEKYKTKSPMALKAWSWFQLVLHLFFMLYGFNHIADFSFIDSVLYGGFLIISVFSYTTLMDRSAYAVFTEGIKVLVAIALFYRMGGWFLFDNYVGGGSMLMVGYLLLSLGVSVYFTKVETGVLETVG